jgi:hypothetical protein
VLGELAGANSYVIEGCYYEDDTTGEEDPVGQTITYLPEDPTVHRLGTIQQRSPTSFSWGALVAAGFIFLPTLGFFLICVLSPGETEPTLQGWWIILGLSTAQIVLVFTTLFLVRQSFLVVLTRYVPAFVGGTIAVLLGVRFFAWRWGIKLVSPCGRVGASSASAMSPRTSSKKSLSQPAWRRLV